MTDTLPAGSVMILRLEGAVAALGALAVFAATGEDWRLAVICFFVPDLSMLGYLFGTRAGAAGYNAAHTYLGPAAIAAIGAATSSSLTVSMAAIWVMHIGFDRMLGYGLKSQAGFRSTHLGSIGRAPQADRPGAGPSSANRILM